MVVSNWMSRSWVGGNSRHKIYLENRQLYKALSIDAIDIGHLRTQIQYHARPYLFVLGAFCVLP